MPILYYTNIGDPVQMLQNAASDQGQHCVPSGIFIQNTVKVKIFNSPPNHRDGQVHYQRRVKLETDKNRQVSRLCLETVNTEYPNVRKYWYT